MAKQIGSGDLADTTETFKFRLSLQTARVRDGSGIPRFFIGDIADSPTHAFGRGARPNTHFDLD